MFHMSLNPHASQQKWSQRDDGMCPWSLASGNTENQTLTCALSILYSARLSSEVSILVSVHWMVVVDDDGRRAERMGIV